jgi:hypothetical protein
MSRRLLDTDILSEIIKGKNVAIAAEAATYSTQHGEFLGGFNSRSRRFHCNILNLLGF